MKLSCQEQLVPGKTFAEKVNWLEQHRFDAIEMTSHDIALRIGDIQTAIAGSSVKLSAMHAGAPRALLGTDPSLVEQTIHDYQGLLKYCALLDCPGLIIIPTGRAYRGASVIPAPTPASDDDIEQLAESLAELAASAEDYGVTLYVAPVNRYESDLIHTVEDAVKLCDAIGRPSLAVVANTFHMNIEEPSFLVSLARYQSRIGYVHVSDSDRRVPGSGHLAFHEFALAHRHLGFDGYLSLDCTIRDEEDLIKAKRYMEKL